MPFYRMRKDNWIILSLSSGGKRKRSEKWVKSGRGPGPTDSLILGEGEVGCKVKAKYCQE